MPLTFTDDRVSTWSIKKIVVVGSGIVGVPMAALLARAAIREGTENAANVVVLQRASPRSGWKVNAINAGRSPIGGIELALGYITAEAVAMLHRRA